MSRGAPPGVSHTCSHILGTAPHLTGQQVQRLGGVQPVVFPAEQGSHGGPAAGVRLLCSRLRRLRLPRGGPLQQDLHAQSCSRHGLHVSPARVQRPDPGARGPEQRCQGKDVRRQAREPADALGGFRV